MHYESCVPHLNQISLYLLHYLPGKIDQMYDTTLRKRASAVKFTGPPAKKPFHCISWFWIAQDWFDNESTKVYPSMCKDTRQPDSWTDLSWFTYNQPKWLKDKNFKSCELGYTVTLQKQISKFTFNHYTSGKALFTDKLAFSISLITEWCMDKQFHRSLYFTYLSFPYFTVGICWLCTCYKSISWSPQTFLLL